MLPQQSCLLSRQSITVQNKVTEESFTTAKHSDLHLEFSALKLNLHSGNVSEFQFLDSDESSSKV